MSISQPTPIDSRSDPGRADVADAGPRRSAPVDGRTARRDRNRCAVLDAAVAIFAEGDLHPAVQDVADRSGVSLRSVYRYFDDVDDLVATAIARRLDALEHRLEAIPAAGSLEERIRRFCHQRLELYRELRPVYRASAVRAAHPDLAARARSVRDLLGRQVRATFAPELEPLPDTDARLVADVLDAVTQLDAIERLVGDAGRELTAVRDQLCEAVAFALDRSDIAPAIGA